MALDGLNVCIVYDCLFPFTHGGAERWYRVLADGLVAAGASVTYLTRRQWESEDPSWPGVRVVAVSRGGALYHEDGTRRSTPALSFGLGTFIELARHRRKYDAVVVASFPFFSLLAIWAALLRTGTPVFVDYHEVWSARYWRSYIGRGMGTLGASIQKLCIRVSHLAQVFTFESAERLRAQGFRGDVRVLAGLLPESATGTAAITIPSSEPTILFVGRHLKHKGVRLLPEILAAARDSSPTLRMTVVGNGPERVPLEGEFDRLGLSRSVHFTGSVTDDELRELYSSASCTIVPSFREGYGIVVAESISAGTPAVVANNPENLATTLIDEGVNGFVVDPTVDGLSRGIIAAVTAGYSLRASTAEWSAKHSHSKSIDRSTEEMVERISKFARK